MRSDTLYGRRRQDTFGIAIRNLELVERPRLDGLRTVGAVAGGLVVWITAGLVGGGLE